MVCVASLDIDGAFDTVSHDGLVAALWEAGVEGRIVRFLAAWWRGRRFRTRLRTPEGKFLSRPRRITRGLPRGGVISPFLRNLYFSQLLEWWGRGAEEEGVENSACLAFAGDVTFVSASDRADELVKAANWGDARVRSGLRLMTLSLGVPKYNNSVMSPGAIIGQVVRRGSGLSMTVNKELQTRQARLEGLLATVSEEALPEGVFPRGMRGSRPYTYADLFKVLGVTLDHVMGFETHVTDVIGRVLVRQGVMAQLARRTCGIEVGVLRSTHGALITSLVRYGLAVAGGFASEQLLNRLEVHYANIAARRITVVSTAARLEVLHPVADVCCAPGSAWRAHNSYAKAEAEVFPSNRYAQEGWRVARTLLKLEDVLSPRQGSRGMVETGRVGDGYVLLLPSASGGDAAWRISYVTIPRRMGSFSSLAMWGPGGRSDYVFCAGWAGGPTVLDRRRVFRSALPPTSLGKLPPVDRSIYGE